MGVIGLGYVGLPLVVEFARAGFDVTGFDVDASKTEQINAGTATSPMWPRPIWRNASAPARSGRQPT